MGHIYQKSNENEPQSKPYLVKNPFEMFRDRFEVYIFNAAASIFILLVKDHKNIFRLIKQLDNEGL